MRNGMKTKPIKKCPFYDGNCLKAECNIYNPVLDNCDISTIAYNSYLVSEAIKALLEKITEINK